jgi:hypothetical protein
LLSKRHLGARELRLARVRDAYKPLCRELEAFVIGFLREVELDAEDVCMLESNILDGRDVDAIGLSPE